MQVSPRPLAGSSSSSLGLTELSRTVTLAVTVYYSQEDADDRDRERHIVGVRTIPGMSFQLSSPTE